MSNSRNELDKYEIRFREQKRELFPYPPIESIINFNFKFLSIGNISSKKITLRIPSKKQQSVRNASRRERTNIFFFFFFFFYLCAICSRRNGIQRVVDAALDFVYIHGQAITDRVSHSKRYSSTTVSLKTTTYFPFNVK